MIYKILVVGLGESASKFVQAIRDSTADVTLLMVGSIGEAMESLNDGRFDMVLGSLELLEMAGSQFIRKVTASRYQPALAIISPASRSRMLSGTLAVRNLGCSVVGAISKPNDVGCLRDVHLRSLGMPAIVRAGRGLRLQHNPDVAPQLAPGAEIPLRFKPRISLLDGRVVAVEAVPDEDHSAPGFDQMLHAVIATQLAWQQQGYKLPVWLKLPLHQLKCIDYPQRLTEQVLSRGGDPRQIGLDVFKCRETDSLNRYAESIYQLGLNGFAVSHDQIGQGYSFYFRLDFRLFSDIKIFLPLIRSAVTNEKLASSLVRIVADCKELGFTVVAEDVTNQAELNLLRQIGCDEAQGLLISDAVDAHRVIDLLISGCGSSDLSF